MFIITESGDAINLNFVKQLTVEKFDTDQGIRFHIRTSDGRKISKPYMSQYKAYQDLHNFFKNPNAEFFLSKELSKKIKSLNTEINSIKESETKESESPTLQ